MSWFFLHYASLWTKTTSCSLSSYFYFIVITFETKKISYTHCRSFFFCVATFETMMTNAFVIMVFFPFLPFLKPRPISVALCPMCVFFLQPLKPLRQVLHSLWWFCFLMIGNLLPWSIILHYCHLSSFEHFFVGSYKKFGISFFNSCL